MKKEITWTLLTGKQVVVTITLNTSKENNLDGDKHTVKCCEQTLIATVDGEAIGYELTTRNIPVVTRGLTIVATIGKLGITQKHYDQIQTAITEIETTPEWQAKIKNEEKNDAAAVLYEKDYNTIKNAMLLGESE